MDYMSLVEKQLKPLLKFAFLYVGDIEEAKKILQKSIKKSVKYANSQMDEKEGAKLLQKEVLRQCHSYSKSFTYQKDTFLKFLGIKWYDSPHITWRRINKLPTSIKEVAISHFIFKETSMEMAKNLTIPPGHVSLYLKKANEKLGIVTPEDANKFSQHLQEQLEFIDEIDVTSIIQHAQTVSTKQKPYLKWSIALVGVVILFITLYDEAEAPVEESTPNDQQTDTGKDLAENNNSIIHTSLEPRIIPDISFEIATHQAFYYLYYIMSSKEARKFAAERLYQNISTIEFANERNIYLSEGELRELEQQNQMILEGLKSNPEEAKYFNKLLEELQITEEQYIDYYLYLENESYAYNYKMYELNVDQQALYQKLYEEETPAIYYERAGITPEEVLEIKKNQDQMNQMPVVTENQFNLPFDLTGSYLNIIQLENGQFVFENPSHFNLYNTKYSTFLENVMPAGLSVNRASFDNTIAYLENFETYDETNKQLARELLEIYKILKQSIEWELN